MLLIHSIQPVSYTHLDVYKRQAFLLEQKKKTISYTHEEIASLTGLNRVTVTKILNDFYQKGWIDLAYRKIIIVDHDELSNYLDK